MHPYFTTYRPPHREGPAERRRREDAFFRRHASGGTLAVARLIGSVTR